MSTDAPPIAAWHTPLDDLRARALFFDTTWRRLLTARTPAMGAYRNAERILVGSLLGRYAGLVEAGCGDGTLLLPVAANCDVEYLGVELAAEAVALARAAIAPLTASGRRAAVVHADIRELTATSSELMPAEPVLVALPFNVLGNVPTPRAALAAARDCGGDVLVLTYRTGQAATEMRRAYYAACGYAGTFRADRYGVHYAAGLFTSSVYRRAVLVRWLRELGYEVSAHPVTAHGLALHGRLT